MEGLPPDEEKIISIERGNHYDWPQLKWTHNNAVQDIGNIADHKTTLHLVVNLIINPQTGVIDDITQIDAIVLAFHR